jgi:GNAT superfamily N-acetyltransferase
MKLMELQQDFTPDHEAQERGVRLILEEPSRGRIFVLRSDDRIIGMANILFTIPIAGGGLVILMEDIVVHPDHRGQGYGSLLLEHVVSFAETKNFRRITFLTDKMSPSSQEFFSKPQFEFSHLIPMRRLLA